MLSQEVMCRYFRFLSEDEIQFLEREERNMQVPSQNTRYVYLLAGGYAGVYADWEDSVFCLPEEGKQLIEKTARRNGRKNVRMKKDF